MYVALGAMNVGREGLLPTSVGDRPISYFKIIYSKNLSILQKEAKVFPYSLKETLNGKLYCTNKLKVSEKTIELKFSL